jgi:cob(I)alamin adenosyltransferase
MTSAVEPPTEHAMPEQKKRAKSLVVVNTGDGKGKSTAAFGILMRSVARGWPVAVVQFLKSGNWQVGERKVSEQLGAEWWAIGEGFTWDSEDLTVDEAVARKGWEHAKAVIQAGSHQLVVLDEVTYPMNWGWIDAADVVDTITNRPEHVNVVATGRNAPEALVAIAHTVTEMRPVKHAFEQGIVAKKGIDY